ncbi:hypothetical protein [Paenibacillus sp. IHB B 3415]|uniref:hypothetical protein n=1 Tax=Paenibacillus sp. IHB B 3415 TaxID=867080 RepID=UPI000B030ECD|nr:hypothetical protein [Paenibacillus sp. IHB B 3415]
MGKGWRKLLIWLSISIIFAVLTDWGTFTYEADGTISGNGNPGIIMLAAGWLFGIILLCSAGMVLYRLFRLKSVFSIPSLLIAVSALIVLPLAIWLETGYVDALRVHLRGFTRDEDSVVFRFGWINQYTNNLFYNAYILAGGIALVILVVWIVAALRQRADIRSRSNSG